MGEGPSLTTPHLRAVPLTMWNAGLVAEDLAAQLGDPDDDAGPARSAADALRRDLRRRAAAGPTVLTWALHGDDGATVGLLSSDAEDWRAVVSVSIGHPYRRRGYATEALRAVSGWIESDRAAVVEGRVRLGDVASERLATATAFVPTEVLLSDRWRVWVRPPAH